VGMLGAKEMGAFWAIFVDFDRFNNCYLGIN
jgi:hypothetical protein